VKDSGRYAEWEASPRFLDWADVSPSLLDWTGGRESEFVLETCQTDASPSFFFRDRVNRYKSEGLSDE
jgi:hypothetical protein